MKEIHSPVWVTCPFIPAGHPSSKRQISVGEDVEKLEPSCTADRNGTGYSNLGKSLAGIQIVKPRYHMTQQLPS